MRRQKNQTLADFTASDIANFWLLYTINTGFPAVPAPVRVARRAPGGAVDRHAGAGRLADHLFRSTSIRATCRSYDHDDLGRCFTELDEKLRLLLETVVPSNVVSLPLKLVQPSIYATSLDQDKYLVNTRMYLAVQRGDEQADLIGEDARC